MHIRLGTYLNGTMSYQIGRDMVRDSWDEWNIIFHKQAF